jgi:soluble lytic murein transglycosylase
MRRWIFFLGVVLVAGCGPRAIRHPGLPGALPLATLADKRAAFARGYTAFQRGDRDLALEIFSALVETYPELADYHLYYVGVLQARRKNPAAAETALRRLLDMYPPSVKAEPAALELGTVLVHSGRVDDARPFLQRALAAADPATVQRARLALAEADERSGDITAAYAGFMSLRRDAPGSAADQTAREHVLALRTVHPELVPAGAARLEEARLLLAEHDYAAAQAAAAEILAQPEGLDPAAAVRVQADALYGEGKIESALSALWRITDRYPDSPAAPGAWFRMATILWNRDRDALALQAFEQLRRRHPSDPHMAEALYASGRIREKAGENDLAIRDYGELVRRFPGNTLAGEAAWRIGWIHYLARDWPAAAATFGRLAERATGSMRDTAAYWQARALTHSGDTAPAQALYRAIVQREPNGYYAMWAQRRLRGDLESPLLEPVTVVAPEPPQPGPALFTDPFHLPRWEELRATGVVALARGELAAIEHAHPGDGGVLQYVLRACQSIDAYAAAVRLLRRAGGAAALPASERVQVAYPLAFWGTVERESQSAAVSPLLVEAVMRQESLFDPEARSPADARGLMQLLPTTAERVAVVNGMQVDVAELTEPDINIALGVRYLRELLSRFGGDPLKTVAAYNGGERAVEKWQRQLGDVQPDEFVEGISYRETRDYVKRVMANYRQYVQLYGSGQ